MFERFTEGARQVVVLAQDEARALKHNYIGTEHLLLGLLREEKGAAARTLESLDLTVEEVRNQIARIVGQGDEVTTGQIPLTPRAKKVLELALREALSLGHNYIGTKHILLGIVRENEGVAARILLDYDIDAESIRDKLVSLPSGKPASRRGPEDPSELTESFPPVPGLSFSSGLSNQPALGPRAPRRSRLGLVSGRMPRRVGDYDPVDYRRYFFLLGFALFGVASGIGLFIGWLIWG
jgi:ATP-dependent Clp protease ATP-binding subunit ClpA